MALEELSFEDLYRTCDAARFPFETTKDVEPLGEVLGQPRATAAVDLVESLAMGPCSLLVLPACALGDGADLAALVSDLECPLFVMR